MRMRRVIGVVLGLVGSVWIAQGIGRLGGSPMTGRGEWVFFGAVLVLAGLVLLLSSTRGRGEGAGDQD